MCWIHWVWHLLRSRWFVFMNNSKILTLSESRFRLWQCVCSWYLVLYIPCVHPWNWPPPASLLYKNRSVRAQLVSWASTRDVPQLSGRNQHISSTSEPILQRDAAKPCPPYTGVEPEQPAKWDQRALLLQCSPSSHIHPPGSSFSFFLLRQPASCSPITDELVWKRLEFPGLWKQCSLGIKLTPLPGFYRL